MPVHTQDNHDEVLAVWTFFDPVIVEPTNKWIQQLQLAPAEQRQEGDPMQGGSGADGLLDRIRLTPERVTDLRQHLDSIGLLYDAQSRDRMPIISQRHGQMVHVPAGYMHQVSNMRPCTKMDPKN